MSGGAIKCQETNCKFRIVWACHSSLPKGQWIRQNKKVVKLKIIAKTGINCDIQEVVCFFLSQIIIISIMIAKMEE
jgi:hypothetical protein